MCHCEHFLHQFCQGIEVILKSIPICDYDKYILIIKNHIGHDLTKAADTVIAEFGLKRLSAAVDDELKSLNDLYKQHFLRYASGLNHFIDPKNIESDRVLRTIAAHNDVGCEIVALVIGSRRQSSAIA